jgi:hypothetical protein
MESPQIHNEHQQRNISEHISKIVTAYNEDMGYKPNR